MTNRSSIIAFFLSFLPGVGFIYIDRKLKGLFYGFVFLAIVVGGGFLALYSHDEYILLLTFLFALFIALIQMVDMIVYLLKKGGSGERLDEQSPSRTVESERFFTLILGMIPGVGHFHLGLLNRGLTFIVAFFGLIMLVFFITFTTGRGWFLIFLGIGLIIWIFNLFDLVQLLKKKENGEILVDRTVLEDLEEQRDSDKKSRAIAMLLSIMPGAGHMYLGLQRRGFQLMVAFILSIYLIDFMRLSLFMFFIPIIWFYSFFDTMQKAAQYNQGDAEDVPIVSYFINKQKWIGIGLILLGLYYLMDRLIIPELFPLLSHLYGIDIRQFYYQYFQTAIVCLLFIGGGIRLMFGSKKKGEQSA